MNTPKKNKEETWRPGCFSWGLIIIVVMLAWRIGHIELRTIGRDLTPEEAAHVVRPECYRLLGPENELIKL
ncbi:MAG: hypothetical protein GY927_13240, partial [bacterium]|nr:hypothetical protein [bacterium]